MNKEQAVFEQQLQEVEFTSLKAHSQVWNFFLEAETPLEILFSFSYLKLSWILDHVEKTACIER